MLLAGSFRLGVLGLEMLVRSVHLEVFVMFVVFVDWELLVGSFHLGVDGMFLGAFGGELSFGSFG